MRLEDIFAAHALRTPGNTAVVVHDGAGKPGQSVTYGELQALAAGLHHAGVRAGDRVLGAESVAPDRLPKGTLITHANFIVQHGVLNAIEWGISDKDVYLVTTPLEHRTGLARMVKSLCLGGTMIAMSRFDAQDALDLIRKEGVTAAGMVPTVARMLMPQLEKDPSSCASLKRIIVTGEAFPVELKRKLIELLPHIQLHSFFAMTEVGPVTSLNHEEQFTHPTSVGRPTPGVQVKLAAKPLPKATPTTTLTATPAAAEGVKA